MPARVEPLKKSKFVVPQISFNPGDFAWFDMSQKITDSEGDEWVPLVNFMTNWGGGKFNQAWKTNAWMKFKKAGKQQYTPVRFGELSAEEMQEANKQFWLDVAEDH